jgi:site-specific DNA recombinase
VAASAAVCAVAGWRADQKGSNWYRCQYGYLRGKAAADVSGHPRVLGVKEDVLLEVVRAFMAERLFGDDRLRLLAEHAAEATGEDWKEHDAEMSRLRREKAKIEKALYQQALRLEEHDDPDHPVVKLATQRIEALSEQEATIAASIASLDRNRPDGTDPAEVEAMLDAIPDLRSALAEADGEELVELFDAFDIAVSYDKPEATLEVSASLRNHLPERALELATAGRSQVDDIAGAGFEPATFGL